jgi:hypothetical protein
VERVAAEFARRPAGGDERLDLGDERGGGLDRHEDKC